MTLGDWIGASAVGIIVGATIIALVIAWPRRRR